MPNLRRRAGIWHHRITNAYILLRRIANPPQREALLSEYAQTHAQAAKPLNRWLTQVEAADLPNHAALKALFPAADYVKNGRYVFNIGGNNYRIVAVVIFVGGVMNIRFVGTHAEYNKVDCSTI